MSYWNVIYRTAWLALAIMTLIGVLCLFLPRWREYHEYQRRRAELADQVRLEEEMLRVLRTRQERFRQDPRFVEQMAHDLGMARPGETLFKFRNDPPGGLVTTNR